MTVATTRRCPTRAWRTWGPTRRRRPRPAPTHRRRTSMTTGRWDRLEQRRCFVLRPQDDHRCDHEVGVALQRDHSPRRRKLQRQRDLSSRPRRKRAVHRWRQRIEHDHPRFVDGLQHVEHGLVPRRARHGRRRRVQLLRHPACGRHEWAERTASRDHHFGCDDSSRFDHHQARHELHRRRLHRG